MILRPFRPADADAVNRVALAAFAQYRGVYSDWDVLERGVGAMAALAGGGEIIVAENGGIAGAVAYFGPGTTPRADFFAPDWPIIRMLVVDPAARGQGIGRRLTEACIERAGGRRGADRAPHQPGDGGGARHVSADGISAGAARAGPLRRALRALPQGAGPGAATRPGLLAPRHIGIAARGASF